MFESLVAGRTVHAALMAGSQAPAGAAPWEEAAREAGFEVPVQETNARHEE